MNNQSWIKLTSIQTAGAVCMPVVLVGHTLALEYGVNTALMAIVVGNLALFLVGLITTQLAIRHRSSTADTVARLGGETLSKIFAIAMVISMLGWFVIQLTVIVEFFHGYAPVLPWALITAVVGLTLMAAVEGDMDRLERLSSRGAPVVLVALLIMFVWAFFNMKTAPELPVLNLNPLAAISLVIAASLVVVVDLPTYYRFATSKRDAVISIFLVAFVSVTIVEITGVLLAHRLTEEALIASWFGVVMVLSGWLMNVNNFYSAVVSSRSIYSNISTRWRTVILGVFGMGLAMFRWDEHIGSWVEGITIGVSSMGGVLVAAYLFERLFKTKASASSLTAAWSFGICAGVLNLVWGLSFTGATQIDAFVWSIICLSCWRLILGIIYEKILCNRC